MARRDHHQAFRLRVRQRPEEDRPDDAVDRRVRADAEGEDSDDRGGEAGTAPK
jgi:hypothetical protein